MQLLNGSGTKLEVFVISIKGAIRNLNIVSDRIEVLVVVLRYLVRPLHQLLITCLYVLVLYSLSNECLIFHEICSKSVVWAL